MLYETLQSVSQAGVHYTFSILGRDSWGNVVDQSVFGYPLSFTVVLCSPALLNGCLKFQSSQNASGYADVSFALSQSGSYSISVQALTSIFHPCVMSFQTPHNSRSLPGGVTANILDIESCLNSPFDLLIESVYAEQSLSRALENIASKFGSGTPSCVLISASLVAPENSMFSVKILTENSALFSSINEQSLDRYARVTCKQTGPSPHTFTRRSSFLSEGKFSALRQLSKELHSPVDMWISTKQASSYKVTMASHRFNEIDELIDNSMFSPSGMLSPFDFSVLPGSVCYTMSSVHGDGLSIFELSQQSVFSIITRDIFGNVRTENPQTYVVSIIDDSLSKPHVIISTFTPLFSEVSVIPNANVAPGYCNHHVGAIVGMHVWHIFF